MRAPTCSQVGALGRHGYKRSRVSTGAKMARSVSPQLDRRTMLGSTAGSALSLLGLMGAQERAAAAGLAQPSRIRSCIFVFHYGGPSHHDTFDMKPEAPVEIRGEFRPISSSAPGIQVCEHLPKLARVMHRVAVVRSLHHRMTAHDSASANTLTGRPPVGGDRETFPDTPETFPAIGAVVTALRRELAGRVPWAALPFVMYNVLRNPGQTPGFLGARYDPFQVDVDPEHGLYRPETLKLPAGIDVGRLRGRQSLWNALDGSGSLSHLPEARTARTLYERAFDLLNSEEVRRATDIEREPPRVRERYGLYSDMGHAPGPAGGGQHGYARNMRGQNLLLARRMVEAGVPFVNVYDFKQQGQNWDSHADGFRQLKDHLLPAFDRGLSALIEDLAERGLLDSTLVVSVGEFGRTPKVNGSGGRDHWPFCYTALLAGGGVRGGVVHGSSDATGAYPDEHPVTPGDLCATVLERFGLSSTQQVHDATGRPWPAADGLPILGLT